MTFEPILLLIGAGALLGAYAMYRWGLSARAIAARIEDTPTTPVSRVTPGFVEVKGRARAARGLLTSPVSRKPCVYYRFLVQELVKRGKSSSWYTRLDDQQECGLLVEDAWQGTVEVNVRAADLRLKPDLHTRSGFLNDAPPELEEALRRYGGTSQGLIFNKTMRYTETVLEAGDEIHVLGTARQQRDGGMIIDQENDLFIVSDQPEEELTRSLHRQKTTRHAIAGLLVVTGVALGALGVAGNFL